VAVWTDIPYETGRFSGHRYLSATPTTSPIGVDGVGDRSRNSHRFNR
jgi:hypothetical protein